MPLLLRLLKLCPPLAGSRHFHRSLQPLAWRNADEWLDAFLRHLQGNRDYALKRLAAMDLIECHKPLATYLLFPDISAFGMDSESFVNHQIEQARLALVPGTEKFFGPGAKDHVRICFATSREILKEGLDRLEKGIGMLLESR